MFTFEGYSCYLCTLLLRSITTKNAISSKLKIVVMIRLFMWQVF